MVKNKDTQAMKKIQSKRGFSFLEVIIVVGIIVIMTIVMFVIAFKDRDKKKVEAVGREVSAAIRETQNNALTGKQGENDGLPCAFAFEIVDGGRGYQVKGSHRAVDGECGPDEKMASYAKIFNKADYASSGITVTGFYPDGDSSSFVVFTVPYGKYVDGRKNGQGTEFVIQKDGDEHKYHICVYATGLIEEIGFKDGNFACSF